MILTLRSAAATELPHGLRRSPVYARALGRARAVLARQAVTIADARAAHEAGLAGDELAPAAQAAAEAWREAECIALATLDELEAPPAPGTRLHAIARPG